MSLFAVSSTRKLLAILALLVGFIGIVLPYLRNSEVRYVVFSSEESVQKLRDAYEDLSTSSPDNCLEHDTDFMYKNRLNKPQQIDDYADFVPFSFYPEKNRTQIGRENATIYMLVRNWELQAALKSIRRLEDRFNRNYRYPWTFLNDEPFTEEFKQYTTAMASGKTEYALIPRTDWNRPPWINSTLMDEKMKEMVENEVIYGGSLSYRNMCRFNSGFFFRQEVMMKYDYYFRVEPDVEYFCDFNYDPFTFMRVNEKQYGFVISLYEYEETIPTLWNTVEDFLSNKSNQHLLKESNSTSFLLDKTPVRPTDPIAISNSDYNLCHFWSNFEIGNLNFFRSPEYISYFEHLDKQGGFYYERWGDAPVHSIGLALFLPPQQIHHFSDIGYYHLPFQHCPQDVESYSKGRCICPTERDNFDLLDYSCLPRWWRTAGKYFLSN